MEPVPPPPAPVAIVAAVAAPAAAPGGGAQLQPTRTLGSLRREEGQAPVGGATWHDASANGDGLEYTFPAGTLKPGDWVWADALLDGNDLTVFEVRLREGANGPAFSMTFGLVNQAQARIAVPMEATLQNRWRYPRSGAFLKPLCGGDRVDLARVDRLVLRVHLKGPHAVRWCVTPFRVSGAQPPYLHKPALPKGKLIDALGQSKMRGWPGRSTSTQQVTDRLKKQLADAPAAKWPQGYSKWGGWADRKFKASGFFRTQHDGRRWWLVDPDGHAFWSAGPNCVAPIVQTNYEGLADGLEWLPESAGVYKRAHYRTETWGFDYLKANLIRAFGRDWQEDWAVATFGKMKGIGFNTVANWSDWGPARTARFPYVRWLQSTKSRAPMVYRDFPDVFDPAFAQDAADLAKQLWDTKDDPALIGYFLANEPTWGFANESPAAGMLYTTAGGPTRKALADHLRRKYGSDTQLWTAWAIPVTFDKLANGKWAPSDPKMRLNGVAKDDLRAFSTVMVDKLFRTIGAECRKVDPHHLNLDARYHTVPPQWVLQAMKSFDVFGVNGYAERVDAKRLAAASVTVGKPILVGEFHFGALDAGLPGPGIVHVKTQADRGRAYRTYLEHAAAQSWCVGAHYFQLYDQSALGRFDGEAYNIGFLDVCNRPYDDLAAAARASHERLYRVADGKEKPFADVPAYLPKLFN